MCGIEEIIDILANDPIRRYRDAVDDVLIDSKRIITKCSRRLGYSEKNKMSIKEKRALGRIRRKATDKITEYIKFYSDKEREIFWDNLLKEVEGSLIFTRR